MKCPNCSVEMETGYALQLGISGIIQVVKKEDSIASGRVEVSVCPSCGKIEARVDHKSIR